MILDFLQIVKTGTTITTSGVSASVAIPTDSANTSPKYIRVSCTTNSYIKVGTAAVTAAAGDILLVTQESIVLNVCGCTHIAALQVAATGTVQISPVENS